MNETKMGFTVHVLMARWAVHIVASVFFKGLGSYFLLQTVRTATATKAHGGLLVGRRFARVVLDEMGLEASVSEKVPTTTAATLGGFEGSRVRCLEIRALFLATGPALFFLVAAMLSLMVIGFPTVGTIITGPEKPG